jgi:hypothetical protein
MFIQFFQYEFLEELAIPNTALLYWSIVLELTACQEPAFFSPMEADFSKGSVIFVSTSIQIARWPANPETPIRSNDDASFAPCQSFAQSHVLRPQALYYAAEVCDPNSQSHQHK